jgi:hypothetical protein
MLLPLTKAEQQAQALPCCKRPNQARHFAQHSPRVQQQQQQLVVLQALLLLDAAVEGSSRSPGQ